MHVLRVSAMVSYQDLLVGLVLLFFFFGAKRLPELAGSLGKSMKEFRKAAAGEDGPIDQPPATMPRELVAASAARTCAACATRLDVDWSHCPRCGTPALAAESKSAAPGPGASSAG